MNKVILINILFFILSFRSYSQNLINNNNVSTEIITGSSFVAGNFGNSVNTFIAPSMSFALNPKFCFKAGFISTTGIYKLKNKPTDYSTFRNYLYAQAQYKLSEKVSITGDIIYGSDFTGGVHNSKNNNSVKSYSFGAIYNLNDNIQFQVNFRQTNSSDLYFDNTDSYFIK